MYMQCIIDHEISRKFLWIICMLWSQYLLMPKTNNSYQCFVPAPNSSYYVYYLVTIMVLPHEKKNQANFLGNFPSESHRLHGLPLLHSTTILLTIPQIFSHLTKHGSNLLTLTILFHLWHLLVIQFYILLVSLVKVVVLLSFSDHSWNSNFSALAAYLHLNLLN